MGKREETLALLKQGYSSSEIARKMGVNYKTTLSYLAQMVGEGRLRRSDILFSVPSTRRHDPTDPADKAVVTCYGDAAHALGDIYEDLRIIEIHLHSFIRRTFETKFGTGEGDWWHQGIPEAVRKACHNRREEDSERSDPYCYTDLIDLRSILDKQWKFIRDVLPGEISSNKPKFMDELLRLNRIRRKVMHPVRGGVPSEEDFDFLRSLKRRLGAGASYEDQ